MLQRKPFVLLIASMCAAAAGAPVVEIVPTTPGPFVPGERVELAVYLSQQDGVMDIPIRLLQFDLADMDPALVLDDAFDFDYSGQAACEFSATMCGIGYAEFGGLNSPHPTVAIVYLGSQENLSEQIILPQSGAILVGSIGVRLPQQSGEYFVDVLHVDASDPNNQGAKIQFDFLFPQEWLVDEFVRIGETHFVVSDTDGLVRYTRWSSPPDPTGPGGECDRDSACDDGNPCTADECSAGRCTHRIRAALCDDGDPCTINDICAGGECFGTPVTLCCETDAECADGDVLTTERCVDRRCVYELIDDPGDVITPPDDPTDPLDPDDDPDDPLTDDGGDVPQDDPAGQPTGDGDGSEGSPRACGAFGLIPGLFMIAGLGFARLRRYSALRFAAPTALPCA